MNELFKKVRATRLPDAVVKAQGGDRKVIEALKRRLDEELIQNSKEIGEWNRIKALK